MKSAGIIDKEKLMDKGMIRVPVYLFRDRNVAVLEALVEYLKDVHGLSYHEIAVLLNRDDRTIWTAYSRVIKKRQYRKNAPHHKK